MRYIFSTLSIRYKQGETDSIGGLYSGTDNHKQTEPVWEVKIPEAFGSAAVVPLQVTVRSISTEFQENYESLPGLVSD